MIEEQESVNKLPKGWIWTRFEEISRNLRAGGTPSTKVKEYYENGTIPFVKIQDIVESKKYLYNTSTKITEEGLRNSSTWLVPKDSLLYSMYASYGEPIINKIEVVTSQAIIAYMPPENLMVLDYVYYYLKKIRPQLTTRGTTQRNLNAQIVRNLLIPFAPLAEQGRIVARIEELFTRLDAGVESLRKVKTQLKHHRQAVLNYAFKGKLTEEWRKTNRQEIEPASVLLEHVKEERRKKEKEKYKELPPIDSSALPQLPEGWIWTTVEEIGLINSGKTPKGINQITKEGDFPFYKIRDMNTIGNEKFMYDSEIYLNKDDVQRLKIRLHDKGTIIFPKRGGAIVTNKKRILTSESAYDLNIMGVYPLIIPHNYFYYWISKIDLITLADGSNVPQINHSDMKPLPFPLPPLAEQYKIVEEIDSLFSIDDGAEKVVELSLMQSERLRQSILKKAFEGRLVPQDPADEPAEKLLERIRKEKETLESEEKKKKSNRKRVG